LSAGALFSLLLRSVIALSVLIGSHEDGSWATAGIVMTGNDALKILAIEAETPCEEEVCHLGGDRLSGADGFDLWSVGCPTVLDVHRILQPRRVSYTTIPPPDGHCAARGPPSA